MEINLAKQILENDIQVDTNKLSAKQVALDLLNNTFSADFQSLETAQTEANTAVADKNKAVVEKNEALAFKDSEIARITSETNEIVKGKDTEIENLTSTVEQKTSTIEQLTTDKEDLTTSLASKQEELDLLTENYNSLNDTVKEVLLNEELTIEDIKTQLSDKVDELKPKPLPVEENNVTP